MGKELEELLWIGIRTGNYGQQPCNCQPYSLTARNETGWLGEGATLTFEGE